MWWNIVHLWGRRCFSFSSVSRNRCPRFISFQDIAVLEGAVHSLWVSNVSPDSPYLVWFPSPSKGIGIRLSHDRVPLVFESCDACELQVATLETTASNFQWVLCWKRYWLCGQRNNPQANGVLFALSPVRVCICKFQQSVNIGTILFALFSFSCNTPFRSIPWCCCPATEAT